MILNVLVCFQIFQLVLSSWFQDMKQIKFDRMDGTCPGENVAIKLYSTIIKRDKAIIYLNYTLIAFRDLGDTAPTFSINIKRCSSKENLDSCENYLTTKPVDYCTIISPQNNIMSPLYVSYNPPYLCPIKKGTYHATNHKFDTTVFMMAPLGNWYWRVKSEAVDPKTQKILFCEYLEGCKLRRSN